MSNIAKILVASAVALGIAGSAQATVELVQNGGFEQTTNGAGQLGYNTDATGWTTSGYNFLFSAGQGDSTTANGSEGPVSFWAPNHGINNGFTDSPTGGNYVGADGAYRVGAIEQTITGLVAGKTYQVSFDWAGAQQYGFIGANTEQWEVRLGTESYSTAIYNNPSNGFGGWFHETFSFTAQGTSAVLSFLAHGTPEGTPPFALLDNVSMTGAVPEPASWAMMLVGFGVVGSAMRRRRTVATA